MAFRSIFSVNGVNANARLDPLRETSSISSSFRNSAGVAYDLDALISVPVGPTGSGFTCQLRLGDGQHTEDLVLGKNWLALYRQHALNPTTGRNMDDHHSQNMGLQYSSRNPLPRVIEAQASGTSTSALSSLSSPCYLTHIGRPGRCTRCRICNRGKCFSSNCWKAAADY